MIQLIDSEDECRLMINGEEIEIIDSDYFVSARCDLDDLDGVSVKFFPPNLILEVHSNDGFGTQLFEKVSISVEKGVHVLDFSFSVYNKYWEGFYGLSAFIEAVHKEAMKTDNFRMVNLETADAWKTMTLRCQMSQDELISKAIIKAAHELKSLEKAAEIALADEAVKKFIKK